MSDKTCICNIKTPDGILFSGEAEYVRIDTDMGRIEIHPNHADLVTNVSFSRIVIQVPNGRAYVLARHGFIEFDNAKNTCNGYFLDGEKDGKVKYETIEEYKSRIMNALRDKKESKNDYSLRFLKKEAFALDKMLSVEESEN
jgi:F0F1-type ATP synthase epsilon subunit